jgi:hypothetical protein
MAKHLSSEELESVMAGRGDESAVTHARECTVCAEEMAGLRLILGGLRESAKRTAERERRLAVRPALGKGPGKGWVRGGVWAGVMAAVMVAVIVPVEMRHRELAPVTAQTTPHVVGVQESGATELSDDALLSGVQNDLSTDVPAPLEPLAGASITTTTSNTLNTKE